MATLPNDNGSNVSIIELDFDGIKQSLREYMTGKPGFTDYNFEGSGLAFLLDVLANNTHMLAFYANMVHNESYLDSAVKRDSIVSHAKHIGYTPRSVTAARARVTIAINTSDVVPGIVIDPGTKFSTIIDGRSYSFVTERAYLAKPVSPGRYEAEDVELVQGRYVNIALLADAANPEQRFVLGNATADTSTLVVAVQNSSADTTTEFFTRADDVLFVKPTDRVYWLQEMFDGNFEIYFGDDVVGRAIRDGNIVQLRYIVTEGEEGNLANTFVPSQQIGGYSVANVDITTTVVANGGADREDEETIRNNAPRNYRAQKRSVTAADYRDRLAQNTTIVTNADSIAVWGGEDNVPVRYGKVFVALKPKFGRVITSALKDIIVREIVKPDNMITITPVIVDPEYLYIEVSTVFRYDPKVSLFTAAELEQKVRDQIVAFSDDVLEYFDRVLRGSKFSAMIDDVERSIDSNLTNLKIKKKFVPRISINTMYEIRFENPIVPGSMETSQFIVNEPTQQPADVYILRDDSQGNIILYKQLTDLSLVVINDQYGTVDYVRGIVKLDGFAPVSLVNSTEVSVKFTPAVNDIETVRNLILSIEPTDVRVVAQPILGTK